MLGGLRIEVFTYGKEEQSFIVSKTIYWYQYSWQSKATAKQNITASYGNSRNFTSPSQFHCNFIENSD